MIGSFLLSLSMALMPANSRGLYWSSYTDPITGNQVERCCEINIDETLTVSTSSSVTSNYLHYICQIDLTANTYTLFSDFLSSYDNGSYLSDLNRMEDWIYHEADLVSNHYYAFLDIVDLGLKDIPYYDTDDTLVDMHCLRMRFYVDSVRCNKLRTVEFQFTGYGSAISGSPETGNYFSLSDVNYNNFTEMFPATVFTNGHANYYWTALNNLKSGYTNTGGYITNQSNNTIYYTRFSEVGIELELTSYDFSSTVPLSMDINFLTDIYDSHTAYDNGYANGYGDAKTEWYQKGKAEGYNLGLQTNSSFLGLMSAIADTPIRFLRSLFNFDLFGMNVAVVVLSCLTAVVIFALIKKIWK